MSTFAAVAVNMAAVIVDMGVAPVLWQLRLPRLCSGCVVIMAVIIMFTAAAAMADVALWRCCGCCGSLHVSILICICFSVCIYTDERVCMSVFKDIYYACMLAHVLCCVCTYPLIFLFVYFVELRRGISSNRLHEMSLCASRGCLCIAEASRMVAFRAADWTKC